MVVIGSKLACYHPTTAWRSKSGRNLDTGKWPITFNPLNGYMDMPVELPCGKCIGCRLESSRRWAVRCVHEAQMHEKNCFITLTYSPENLPENGSLNKRDIQLFMKRLRFRFGAGIRFFQCGEYGDQTNRPHHHVLLFGHDFDDKYYFKSGNGIPYYRSPALEELWTYGISTIGELTFNSCAYVARYIMKKINGAMAEDHYQGRLPEFVTMSRKPGIGKTWIEKYYKDVYPNDYVVVKSGIANPKIVKSAPPRYYDNWYNLQNPLSYDTIILRRKIKLRKLKESGELSYDRLEIKEQLKNLKIQKLVRTLE